MIKNCIMSGGEIFIFIFLALLVLAGVIVAIYFILKHDDKKNNPPTNSGGGSNTGTGNGVGPTGPTNPLVSGNFSISPQINPNVFMTFNESRIRLPVITSSDTSISCTKYSWQNISNNRFRSALISNATEVGGFVSPVNLASGGFTAGGLGEQVILTNDPAIDENTNFKYSSTNKTWCSITNPTSCLFYNSNGIVTLENISAGNFANQLDNFKWDNIPVISSPNCAT